MQDISLGINDAPIALPLAICVQAVATNQFSLVVVPLNLKRQNLRAMVAQMPRLWGFEDSVNGRIIGPNKIQFLFSSEETMNLVLRRAPWSFAEWMIMVHKWFPNLSEEATKVIPFWIQVHGIPLQFLTRDIIQAIENCFAPVVEIEFDDASTRVDFVRVRVLWKTDDPLRFQRLFQFEEGVNKILKFRFKRLHNFYQRCGMLNHEKKDCPIHTDGDDDGDHPDMDNENDDEAGDNDLQDVGGYALQEKCTLIAS